MKFTWLELSTFLLSTLLVAVESNGRTHRLEKSSLVTGLDNDRNFAIKNRVLVDSDWIATSSASTPDETDDSWIQPGDYDDDEWVVPSNAPSNASTPDETDDSWIQPGDYDDDEWVVPTNAPSSASTPDETDDRWIQPGDYDDDEWVVPSNASTPDETDDSWIQPGDYDDDEWVIQTNETIPTHAVVPSSHNPGTLATGKRFDALGSVILGLAGSLVSVSMLGFISILF